MKVTLCGALKWAMFARANSRSSLSSARAPCLRTSKACGASPQRSCGSPTIATSCPRRMPQENAFDLNGGDVFAAANDDVFQAVADLDKYRMRSIGWRVRFLRGRQNWKRRDLALSLTRDLPITRSRHHRPM